jgi:hypothetical protein
MLHEEKTKSIVSVRSAPFTSSLIANGYYLGALAASFLGSGKANSDLRYCRFDLAVTTRPVSVVTLKIAPTDRCRRYFWIVPGS